MQEVLRSAHTGWGENREELPIRPMRFTPGDFARAQKKKNTGYSFQSDLQQQTLRP